MTGALLDERALLLQAAHGAPARGYRWRVRRRIGIAALSSLALVGGIAPAARAESRQWTQRALGLQYRLASDVELRNAPWVYTHNSFNSVAEMGPTLSDRDPNQQISIVDQLDEGVRHLEIDEHLFLSPSDPRVGPYGPVVCHATGPAAGCSAEKPLVVVLREIRGWLDRHPDQVILLYLESHLDSVAGYDAGAASIEEAMGDLVYRPRSRGVRCDAMPLELTRDQVRAARKQVVSIGPCGLGARWPSFVFDETPRKTGDENSAFRDFPDCGPDFKRPQYDAFPIRYYEDSTQLTRTTKNGGTDPVTSRLAARMVRCGVDLIGFDQLVRGDPRLEALVWSWAPGQPAARGSCSVQRADTRWEARACTQRHRVACRGRSGAWVVPRGRVRAAAAPRLCGKPSLVNGVPRTGYEDQLLRVAAARSGAATVWLGQRRRGADWKRFETKGCGPSLRRASHRWPVRDGIARFVVRLRFACTGERLRRRIVVRGGLRPVRSRTGRRLRVRVRPAERRLRVRYVYRGKRRTATVRLQHA